MAKEKFEIVPARLWADELEALLVSKATQEGKRPLEALLEAIDAKREAGEPITVRPSGIVEFFDNSLAWAVKQVLGVSFGGNANTIIGTAVHAAADFGFKAHLRGEGVPEDLDAYRSVVEAAVAREMQWADPDTLDMSEAEMVEEAMRLFEAYLPYLRETAPAAVDSETRREVLLDEEAQVFLAGTVDRVYKDADGELAISDLKTSSKGIFGEKVEIPEELQRLKEEYKAAKKRPGATEEVKELKEKLKEAKRLARLKRPKEADLTALFGVDDPAELPADVKEALEAKVAEIEAKIEAVKAQAELAHQARIAEIEAAIAPLQAEVDAKQHAANAEAAARKHGPQLAAYAFLYEAATGKAVNRGRIELIVRYAEKPAMRVYDFDLRPYKEKVDEQVTLLLDTLKAWKAGVPARVLFRHNPETFRGSELRDMIYGVEKDFGNLVLSEAS